MSRAAPKMPKVQRVRANKVRKDTSRLTLLAFCLSLALMLFFVELQLPLIAAIPGCKLGLANIVTVVSLVIFRAREAFLLLILRIVIASIFSGNLPSLLFSLVGGLLALFAGFILLRTFPRLPLVWLSIKGAVCHNAGQLIAAAFWLGTLDVFYYAPVLVSLALVTGVAIGFLAQEIMRRLWWQENKYLQK